MRSSQSYLSKLSVADAIAVVHELSRKASVLLLVQVQLLDENFLEILNHFFSRVLQPPGAVVTESDLIV